MPVNTVAGLLGVGDGAIWRVLAHYVEAARAQADYSDVCRVGADETASRRGQRYISLFHDLGAARLLFACEGRDQGTVKRFAEDLSAHGGDPQRVEAVCMDMSKAYIAGATKHLPNTAITFDAFHVFPSWPTRPSMRCATPRSSTNPACGAVAGRGSKTRASGVAAQILQFYTLSRSRLKTAHAWRLKESLRDLLATAANPEQASTLFARWYSWARRSRLASF